MIKILPYNEFDHLIMTHKTNRSSIYEIVPFNYMEKLVQDL